MVQSYTRHAHSRADLPTLAGQRAPMRAATRGGDARVVHGATARDEGRTWPEFVTDCLPRFALNVDRVVRRYLLVMHLEDLHGEGPHGHCASDSSTLSRRSSWGTYLMEDDGFVSDVLPQVACVFPFGAAARRA